eukprot:761900-Hanusia_phi.AAC.4
MLATLETGIFHLSSSSSLPLLHSLLFPRPQLSYPSLSVWPSSLVGVSGARMRGNPPGNGSEERQERTGAARTSLARSHSSCRCVWVRTRSAGKDKVEPLGNSLSSLPPALPSPHPMIPHDVCARLVPAMSHRPYIRSQRPRQSQPHRNRESVSGSSLRSRLTSYGSPRPGQAEL